MIRQQTSLATSPSRVGSKRVGKEEYPQVGEAAHCLDVPGGRAPH